MTVWVQPDQVEHGTNWSLSLPASAGAHHEKIMQAAADRLGRHRLDAKERGPTERPGPKEGMNLS
jgi:hypothetical protein